MTTLISDSYRKLNAQLHASDLSYGTSGHKWAKIVEDVARSMDIDTILDYAAGKCTLAATLHGYDVRSYDPCVPGIDALPEPAELVVATDFMEHVEPQCVEAVLDHIQSLAKRAVFLVIATRPAQKTLADGRNAHLIQEPCEWWMPQLMARWRLIDVRRNNAFFTFIGNATPVATAAHAFAPPVEAA